MADTFFSFTPYLDGIQENYGPLEDFRKEEAQFKEKRDHLIDMEMGEANPNEYGFHQGEMAKKVDYFLKDKLLIQHQQPIDEFHFNALSPTTQPIQESAGLVHIPARVSETSENNTQMPHPSPLASPLKLLTNYGSGFKKLKGEKLIKVETETSGTSDKLSTVEIMKVAGARYVQFSTQMCDDYNYMAMHPFGFALSCLSDDDKRDVELAHLLLAAAEKVGYQQYERAERMLLRCEWVSSARGNPAQRVIYHFAEALRERIEKESGRVTMKGFEEKDEIVQGLTNTPTFLINYKQLPFTQVLVFTGIQTMVETIASERKVHLIDTGIRYGVHWTVLMQALADRQDYPIELLKITAVGSTDIEEIGTRLASFAKSLNLPFSFKSVILSDMKDAKEELFETEEGETIIIYAPYVLRTMIPTPDSLENLMRVMRNLNPTMMVVFESEGNHNSPSFVNRFTDALFYYSAYYESLDTCMKQYDEDRIRLETVFGDAIRNIVAEEGEERTIRSVPLDVWRAYFGRFGMVEIGISESSFKQASLVLQKFDCRSCCTIHRNGKSLVVGWKGTPIHSLSVWGFR
ncbi:hypothetical protein F2P56_024970 [Juglans regia]|uniref:DELLA protein RGL1-like n=2 Tax=Juglans regia TaxID=51240 RepID=A0A833TTF2_JUGRE|nr:DELLA protein RGL1-like [Juglans regia]KAF5455391.1 hypothetical protein F2P56_024970 [Juglans regia]